MSYRMPYKPAYQPKLTAVLAAKRRVDSDVAVGPSGENLDASDVWMVPSNGRVVFDERGNSTWQWPSLDDPFAQQRSLDDVDASSLSIVEPSEIRRSQRPWLHESERPERVVRQDVRASTPDFTSRKR
jgi:hypothetical protein